MIPSNETTYIDGDSREKVGFVSYLLLAVFLLLLPSLTSFTQITGRVTDAGNGEALDGAKISDDHGQVVYSGSNGEFILNEDSTGMHSIRISCLGYREKTIETDRENMSLTIGLTPLSRNIGEVVVTAPAFGRKLKYSTSAIGILTADEISRRNDITLSAALNRLPGVYMASGTYSTNRLIIRGIGSRTPYSTNRIRAYFGDIPLTSGDGTTTIEDVDAASAGRIEVIRGPSSALYGSGLGGTFKITPFYPDEYGLVTSIKSDVGSFGTFRNVIKSGFNNGSVSMGAIFSKTVSEGFRENSRYSRNSLYLSGSLSAGKSDIRLLLSYTDIHAMIPSSINQQNFLEHPEYAAPNWLAIKGFEKDQRLLTGISFNRFFNPMVSNKLTFFSSIAKHYESRPFNILSDNSFSLGFRETARLAFGNLKTDGGIEAYTENYNWKIFQTNMGTRGDLLNDNAENRSYLNVFVHTEYTLSDKVRAEAGMNLNILRYGLRDELSVDNKPVKSYSYDPVLSPRAGINFNLTEETFVYASAGHGFSAPSLEETLLPEGNINPDLKPEQGWDFDLGTRGHLFSGFFYFDACLYYIRLNDLLVTKRLTEDTFIGINAGKTSHYGLEMLLKFNVFPETEAEGKSLTISSALTLSGNRFLSFTDNGISYNGKQLPGIPSAITNLDAELRTRYHMDIYAGFNYVGSQYMTDSNDLKYASYHTFDVKLSWRLPFSTRRSMIDIYAAASNIFNEKYASMILVNAPLLGDSPPRYYYPAEPFNVHFGIRIDI